MPLLGAKHEVHDSDICAWEENQLVEQKSEEFGSIVIAFADRCRGLCAYIDDQSLPLQG